MKIKLFNSKSHYLILMMVVVCVVTRLWNVHLFPAALTHDEIVYAAQAISYAVNGTSTDGTSTFIDLKPAHPMYAELPAKLMAPFFLIFDNPLIATRSLVLLMGILLPFVLAWFCFGLWKNKRLSYIVMVVAVFNPLLWQMSRLAYDAVYSSFFYLTGGAIVLNWRGKKALLSALFFVLGFFEYQGYKLILLPWLIFLGLVLYQRVNFEVKRLPFISFLPLLLGLLTFILYLLLLLPNQHVDSRFNQTIFADTQYQSDTTNFERRTAISNPLQSAFSNKYIATGKYVIKRFFDAYSLESLFLSGEPARSKFAVWGHGWFYYIDILLIVLGIGYVSSQKKERLTAFLLGLLMLASTIPATLNAGESWNLLRMFFPNTVLILFISWGCFLIWEYKRLRILLLGIYGILILNFAYIYYFRYPLLGANTSYLSERVVSEYLVRSKQSNPQNKFFVYTVDPPVMFWSYLVYSNRITPETKATIARAELTQEYSIDNITFSGRCVDLTRDATILTESWRGTCEKSQSLMSEATDSNYSIYVQEKINSVITIPSIIDNGAYFRIYNNNLCTLSSLPEYVAVRQLNTFNIAHQSNEQFCQAWIANFH